MPTCGPIYLNPVNHRVFTGVWERGRGDLSGVHGALTLIGLADILGLVRAGVAQW
jgi:hypothetical protein